MTITLTRGEEIAAENLGDMIADFAQQLADKNGGEAASYVDAVVNYVFGEFADQYPDVFVKLLRKSAA